MGLPGTADDPEASRVMDSRSASQSQSNPAAWSTAVANIAHSGPESAAWSTAVSNIAVPSVAFGTGAVGGLSVVPVSSGNARNFPADKRVARQTVAEATRGPEAKDVFDVRCDATATGATKRQSLQLETSVLLFAAAVDNALSYGAFYVAHSLGEELYNVVEIQISLVPGLADAMLAFSIVGTAAFAAMIVLVECMQLPLFHELMQARLVFSALPSAILSFILLWYVERTHWLPATALVSNCGFAFLWCFHMRIRYAHELNVYSKIALDMSWFISLAFAIGIAGVVVFDGLPTLTKSIEMNCPVVENAKMPVYVIITDTWYCAEWGKNIELSRPPTTRPKLLQCTDTFAFAFGSSIEVHDFTCPVGCLSNPTAAENVVGCGVYAVDSSVCVAAIHAGVMTNSGGAARVYGRTGLETFESCSTNSVASSRREAGTAPAPAPVPVPAGSGSTGFYVPTAGGRRLQNASRMRRLNDLRLVPPQILDAEGTPIPLAFHFNNLPSTREFLWLRRYEKVPEFDDLVVKGEPWTRYDGIVSLRIAGVVLENEPVRLGSHPRRPLFTRKVGAAASGASSEQAGADCSIKSSGVLCNGVGHAVVELDFCRPDLKACPG
jgi:hypothetical protein